MLISEAKQWITEELQGVYDKRELQSVMMILLEEVTGKSIKRIVANPETEISQSEHERLKSAVSRLKVNEPVQYVIGKSDFFGITLHLRSGVLIPRGETEELVDWIINAESERNERTRRKQILDIGCGSGAIGIALALNLPDSDITAIDISQDAVDQTMENWKKTGGGDGLKSRNGSVLSAHTYDILQYRDSSPAARFLSGPFDIIVSNPPYLMESQKIAMDRRVVDFEPAGALFVPDDDPLLFYEAIAGFAMKHLHPGGSVYMEINDRLGPDTRYLLRDYFPSVELRRDINGKDRMVKACHG